jgi:hypothetical protein
MTDIYTSITSLLVSILLFTSIRAQNSLQELQSCLGPLSTYLVTDSYTYNTANPYYKFSWLQTGNRIRTVKIPMGVLMVQDISTIPTAGNINIIANIIKFISQLCKDSWYSSRR